MRTLVFDGRTGAAGDMICAALIAAGADPAVLDPVEAAIPVRYERDTTTRNGIAATTVDVISTGGGGGGDTPDHTHDGDSGQHTHDGDTPDHTHDGDTHHHTHDEDTPDHIHDEDSHNHIHDEDTHHHAEHGGVHRSYPAVVELVESMDLPPAVESTALDAFSLLGRAEAAVHGTQLTETAFHEVGADDAIADIVGAALLAADLDVDRIVTTPLAVGGGHLEMSHGVYPIPAPAVVEIATMTSLTLTGGPIERELLTPTGAAILGTLATGVDAVPTLSVEAAGYGAGTAAFADHPNVLRALVGDSVQAETNSTGAGSAMPATSASHDDIVVLETALDDATPEVLGGLHASLTDAGARDVTIVPTAMKKSRPGHLVTVICKPADATAVTERLARETGTLGIRQSGATHRWVAERTFETAVISVDGDTHEVSVKVASTSDGEVYDVSAEYDDAAAVAAATDLPVRAVLRRAEQCIIEDSHAEV